MRKQGHEKRPLHHEKVGYQGAPNLVAMEMEMEVSLVGDDTYSKLVLLNVPFKGEVGKKYINLVLNLVREVKKRMKRKKKRLT